MAALVGRDTEMARLRALLDDAAAGRAVTALVGGDAGVGKSRLIAEVMAVGYGQSTYRDAIAFVILVLILIVKPTGIMGKGMVEKV